jgi:predicted ATPase
VFDFEARGPLPLKGKSTPMEAWQVTGLRAAPGSARGLEGLRAPLVGREAELQRLRQRLAALRAGQSGGWVTLSGEAGLGKSRLVAELRDGEPAPAPSAPSPAAVNWLEGHCTSYGQAVSYLPWRQVIRQSLGALEGEPVEAVRARLEYTACECCHIPGGDLPFLEAMLAVASQESLQVVQGLAGDELVHRMTDAVRGYLCGLAQEQPVVIVLEDLHWADDASVALLDNV